MRLLEARCCAWWRKKPKYIYGRWVPPAVLAELVFLALCLGFRSTRAVHMTRALSTGRQAFECGSLEGRYSDGGCHIRRLSE